MEANNKYRKIFEEKGLTIAATTKDGNLVEALELKDHPFFIGVQFHPEIEAPGLKGWLDWGGAGKVREAGLDPEITNNGRDNTIYPRQRSFLFGANVKF